MAIDLSGAFSSDFAPTTPQPAPGVKPNKTSGADLSPFGQAQLADAFAGEMPKQDPPPSAPQVGSYVGNRAVVEHGGDQDSYWATLQSAAGIPTKQKRGYLQQFLETPSVDMTNMKEAPLTAAYQLAKLAQNEGYRVVFQSGARGNGGKSYHDHGEAVDVRFQKQLSDGKTVELTPRENVELGKRLGKAAGWASALDEFHFWSDGKPKSDPWNNAPHVHLAWGNEKGFPDHPMHTKLTDRYWTDANYLKQPVYSAQGYQGVKPKDPKDPVGRAGIPGLVETMAYSMGVDPDVAVNWVNAESAFDPHAVSPAGAKGLVQMMPDTLKEVGPKVGVSEEEFHRSPKAQLKVGLYYLKQKLQENNGNYARALAAYNAGSGGLQAIREGKSYAETNDYVYKILKESDDTITSPEAALQAIRNGTGRTRDVVKDQQLARDTINGTRKQITDVWSELTSDMGSQTNLRAAAGAVGATLKTGAPELESLKDPLSGKRRVLGLTNEMLHDASFGIIPLFESTLQSSQAHAQLLEGDDSLLARADDFATTGSMGAMRLWAAAMTGSILSKGLRIIPGLGTVLQKGDLASKAVAMTGGPAVAEGGSLLSKALNVVKGGPLEIFKANLYEQMAAGAVGMGTMAASDYMWNNPDNATGMDYLYNIVAHGLTGATKGGLVGGGLALGIPLFGGVGLTALNRLTGIGSANMSDNAVNALAQHFGTLNPLQRTLAGGVGGTLAGSLTGAVGSVMMGSEDPAGDILHGSQIGGLAGIGAGLGYNKIAGLLDRAATSQFMQSPQGQAMFGSIKSWVQGLNEKTVRVMSQEFIDAQAETMASFKRSVAHANGTIHVANIGDTLADIEKAQTQQTSYRDNLKGQLMQGQQQGVMIQQLEASLDHKYPNASAFEKARTQKISALQQIGKDPNQAAKAAELQADLQAMMEQAKGDKDLAKERSLRNAEGARIQAAKTQWAQKMGAVKEQLSVADAAVDGLDFVHSSYSQVRDDLQTRMAGSVEDLLATKHELKLEGPWNISRPDPRSALLNTETEGATQLEALNDLLTRQSQSALRQGVNRGSYDYSLAQSQATRGSFAKSPEEFRGAVQKRISDLKTVMDEIDERVPQPAQIHRGIKSFNSWQKNQLASWEASVPKGAAVATANAEALRAGLLEELEKAGGGVDRQALWQEAGQRASARYSSKTNKIPSFDKGAMLDLAKDAEAAMRMGETELPVQLTKDQLAEFQAIVKRGGVLSQNAAKSDALKELADLEKVFAPAAPLGRVEPLMTGSTENPTPVAGKLAEGAVLDSVLNPTEGWASAARRVSEIESGVKARLGVFGDVEALTHFLDSGNMNYLPDEVKNFIASGGDLKQAPPSVKAWSDAVTLARVEEVKRLRQLEGLLQGKGEEGAAVLSSLRNAQAAGYAPPPFGTTPDPFFKALADVGSHDSMTNALVSKTMADIAASDRPTLWDKVFPMAQNLYHDHVYSRMNTLNIIKNRMVKPKWEQIEADLTEKLKATGREVDTEGLYKKFTEAVEDTGKLIKFREDHPEAENMVNFYYGMQDYMESIVAQSPHLKPWVQANYLPHRFRKLASHLKAAQEGERLSMAEAISSGEVVGKFRTLADVDEAVKGVTKEVIDSGFESVEDFLNMGVTERAKRLKFFKAPDMDQAWKDLKPSEQLAEQKAATKKALTLLLQDPVTHPLELVDMQLSSLFRADSQRRFLGGLANTPAALDKEGRVIRRFVEPVTGNALLEDTTSGKPAPFYKLSGTPGMSGVELEINGKNYKAKDLQIHPEVHRFLNDYATGSGYSDTPWVRGAQRLQGIFRNSVLLGTFIPHNLNTLSGHLMEFVTSPMKMMKLTVGGANLGGADQFSQAAMMANAVRSGLNVRTLERSAGIMAKSVFTDFGDAVTNRLYGVEQGTVGQFLQALDPGDAMAGEAKKAFQQSVQQKFGANAGKFARAALDTLGLPMHLDHIMNREMLFRPIEMGQLAGFHLRAQQYLLKNASELAHLDPAERIRVAMRVAADQSNRAAGALPHIFQNNSLRQATHAMLLTPSWFLTKAHTVVDALDSGIYLASKAATGKGRSVLGLVGRKPFDYLPEAMQDATRSRMAGMVGAGLIGSWMMTQAAQFFSSGTLTTDHPPDKLFHVKVGDEYLTGPVMGYVRDVLRFMVDASSSDGWSYNPGAQSVLDATIKAVTRQLNPSIQDMTNYFMATRRGEVLDAPDIFATFVNSAAQEIAGAPLETLGVDRKLFKVENLPGYTPFGSEEQKAGAKASVLKARHYLLQQAGVYSSPDNLDMQLRGHFYNRTRDLEFRAKGEISPLLQRAKNADGYEEQNRFLSMAYDKFYKGIPVKDKFMQDYYPEGTYRLSDKEFEALVLEHFNPTAKALDNVSGSPVGMMMAQARVQYGR